MEEQNCPQKDWIKSIPGWVLSHKVEDEKHIRGYPYVKNTFMEKTDWVKISKCFRFDLYVFLMFAYGEFPEKEFLLGMIYMEKDLTGYMYRE